MQPRPAIAEPPARTDFCSQHVQAVPGGYRGVAERGRAECTLPSSHLLPPSSERPFPLVWLRAGQRGGAKMHWQGPCSGWEACGKARGAGLNGAAAAWSKSVRARVGLAARLPHHRPDGRLQ